MRCLFILTLSLYFMTGCNPVRPHEERRTLQIIEVSLNENRVAPGMQELGEPPRLRLQTLYARGQCISLYRTEFSDSLITDEELVETFDCSKIEIQRSSKKLTIKMSSHNKKLAADLAEIYAGVCEEISCARTNIDYSGRIVILKRVESQ